MSTEKEILEQQTAAVVELRKAVESGKSLTEEKIDALKVKFLEGETANQKLVAEIEKQKEVAAKLQEDVKLFEKQFNRMPGGTDASVKSEAIKSFEKYLKDYPKQEKHFTFNEMDAKYLRTDLASAGGVLVPEILFNELVKQEIEVSPILANSRVINSTAKALEVAIRTTIPSVNRVGEGGTSVVSQPAYKKVRLEAYRNDVVIPITREELNFAAFNMETEMTSDAALALASQSNADFINGNGVAKSEGLLVNSSVTTLNSGTADNIDMDNFLNIQKKDNIKGAYRNNGKFYMNTNTIFTIATLKDGMGQYLWQSNLQNGLPNTIAGKPYIDAPDMDDIGANKFPVIFGDLKKAYYILRAIELELVVDPYSSKKEGIIEYMWIEYLGGKVVLPEAIVKLKCAV
jgi:HK97 family phage major capsid protein